jgi:hypothetical protein
VVVVLLLVVMQCMRAGGDAQECMRKVLGRSEHVEPAGQHRHARSVSKIFLPALLECSRAAAIEYTFIFLHI